MTEPEGAQPQQVQLQPWSWQFPLIGETPTAKIMGIVIQRQMGETLIFPAAVEDMKRFHEQLGEAIAKYGGGVARASAADIAALLRQPPNGRN